MSNRNPNVQQKKIKKNKKKTQDQSKINKQKISSLQKIKIIDFFLKKHLFINQHLY